jgi:hypothetical protein
LIGIETGCHRGFSGLVGVAIDRKTIDVYIYFGTNSIAKIAFDSSISAFVKSDLLNFASSERGVVGAASTKAQLFFPNRL